ncbi:SbcC/MukB-like Walker B domain-containing protein [Nocardia seriolae]|uniref:SbcC/MukB-like Walker B domain-containing protein n=1 Tax=Nocardia seriolae TaxID=37332 RepID=UPI0008FF2162|nr:SbcC/MukB-like Walker B domain-containing protein [Nocardia seriolae]OJF80926.1 endonuclease [Nocardia seriolae]PSK32924.1 endonuclease [Nocardia seriolae]QOW35109.1 endonuclease [Nocardia seriolae]QUN17426.1 endonuclease [Nocardia seriolae]WNJ62379.1 SbcC/MukB-like Walker B domain-containing protein [Nocardia seriolae]
MADHIHGGVRFVPTRAGIINLWDYRDQEFCFADGRLVLRGPNGSGKTKALEVLFPFVLDGRIEPRRLNPFAGEERTMKSNLLYRKQESAYSYVWMEFARGSWDSPETVTIGIGMRATRSNDKVTRWYFVADGRVGVDFSLLGPDDRPLTRKQLAEQIGSDAIVDRPVEYRNAIDARMFGLGQQRYDQLINLILTLRRPQLAKNLDPRGLSQALTDGLRPLDEQLILDAARSFSDMEEVGRTLEGLIQADTATRDFVKVYHKYLAVQAKTDIDQVRTRLDAVTHSGTALHAAAALRRRRDTERAAAETRAEDADRAYEQALADRETLQRSSAYEGKQQLDDLADAVRRLETSAAVHNDKALKSRQTVDQRLEESERAQAAVTNASSALARGEDELRSAAEEAGIPWTTLPESARADNLTTTVRSHAEERDADVRAVRRALTLVDQAVTERTRAERAAQRAVEARESAAAELAAAEAGVALARSNTAVSLRDWWDTHREVYSPIRTGLFEAIDDALAMVGTEQAPPRDATSGGKAKKGRGTASGEAAGNRYATTGAGGAALEAAEARAALAIALDDDTAPATPAEVLAERTEPLTDEIRARRQEARARAAQATTRAGELRAERESVAAERDDAPAGFAARTDIRPDRPGAPLWRLVRFADAVPPARAAGIEAALQAANLLDAWVCPGEELPEHASDQFLVPLPPGERPSGRTLADVLVVEDDTDSLTVPRQTVADVLASIALHESDAADGKRASGKDDPAPGSGSAQRVSGAAAQPVASGGGVAIGADGRFRQGVQVGRHVKADAEFIGTTARARRRELRLAELAAAIEAAVTEAEIAAAAEQAATDELGRISAAAKALPRTTAVTAALRGVAEAAGMLRSRAEAAGQAERDLDQAVAEYSAADKKVRAIAADHKAPRDPAELDALAAAVRHFENAGTALLRLRGDHQREHERAREAGDRLEESKDLAEAFAEEAEAARSGYQEQLRKLETLRDALGAGAADIDRELEAAREKIDAARAEQKAARKAAAEAIEAVGTAEGAHRAAHDTLGTALTELLADVRHLAPYARPDLLSLLGAPAEIRWPSSDAAWPTPEQLLYRIENGDPEQAPKVLPDEVSALFETLATATASVRAGEAARKATRSAVTTALQEFDAALTAARQDYRLHWDAADGLTVVQVHDDHGLSALADFAERIGGARRDQELLLTDAERRILEDALLTGLAQQIHERTSDARDLISRMGTEMKQRRMSSGNTIGVHWVLADNLSEPARAVCKLLDRDSADLTPEDLSTIRAYFAAEIRTARTAHPERSFPEILAATLDYRAWRIFSFTILTADGTEDRLTVARHSALSGGEQSVSLHLPLFAAAHVMLDSADPQAPRLLALDEAFAGVDDNGRSELLGLSVQFDLDLFMTGYDLWITYPHVPACAHYDLAHSAAENTVSATLLVWDSDDLLAEHDGSDLTTALGSPNRRRLPHGLEGAIPLDEELETVG